MSEAIEINAMNAISWLSHLCVGQQRDTVGHGDSKKIRKAVQNTVTAGKSGVEKQAGCPIRQYLV